MVMPNHQMFYIGDNRYEDDIPEVFFIFLPSDIQPSLLRSSEPHSPSSLFPSSER